MWTLFWDMNSGGGRKEKWHKIYIEAPEREARVIFYNRFGHNPSRVTCTCCGEDYVVNEEESLEQLSGFHRGCDCVNDEYVERPATRFKLNKYQTLDEYKKDEGVLIIHADEIKPEERVGEVPTQGYVWEE